MLAKYGGHYLQLLCADGTLLGRMMLEDKPKENWSSVLVNEEKNRTLSVNYAIINGCDVISNGVY